MEPIITSHQAIVELIKIKKKILRAILTIEKIFNIFFFVFIRVKRRRGNKEAAKTAKDP